MRKNKIILAVDTSNLNLSMSLYKNEEIFHCERISEDHSENLTKFLELLLKKADINLKNITQIAVNIGPGSFTGLRIGLSFVKTLSLYLNIKIITTTSFHMLLSQILNNLSQNETQLVTSIFPSVKNEFYFCNFAIKNKNIKTQEIGYKKMDELEMLIKNNRYNKNYMVLCPKFLKVQEFIKNLDYNVKSVEFSSKSILDLINYKLKGTFEKKSPQNLFPLYIRHTYY